MKFKGYLALILVGGTLLASSGFIVSRITEEQVTFTVNNTERIVDTTADTSYYLVFTQNETFKNEDTFYYLKFNSSDVQGNFRVGETYNATVYGMRVPFFSSYRNIVSANLTNSVD